MGSGNGVDSVSVVIQKYGGSSVATPEKIKAVAGRIGATKDLGHDLVVVVSAMGNTTDELLALAKQVSPQPQRRELDMLLTVGERISMALLSMALQDLGYQAVSFTGSQSGIITTNDHTNARIIRVTPYRIQAALQRGDIVIVAGFQGVSERKEITSLGRGDLIRPRLHLPLHSGPIMPKFVPMWTVSIAPTLVRFRLLFI